MDFGESGTSHMLRELKLNLLKRDTILLDGSVNQEMAEYVAYAISAMAAKNNLPLLVNIMTGGGDVVHGLDIYDMLSTYPNTITGTVIRHAKSMGAVILQACSLRLAHIHAQIMIHHISRRSVSLDVLRSAEKTSDVKREMEERQKLIYTILANRTKQSIDQITQTCELEKDMLAQEALTFGLIDGIVPMRQDAPKT